ncbi:MAG: hypothetical protein E6Q98_19370 [Rhodospirillaceae bacterium]|nr:MAG: hypothetical protein E6Q98_19370 [Rhodospirillaceae bacterium]
MADLLWHSERRLWLEGVDAFKAIVHPDCIMAFAAPIGVMKGRAIIESLKDAPRWTEVEMSLQTSSHAGDATVLPTWRRRIAPTPVTISLVVRQPISLKAANGALFSARALNSNSGVQFSRS